MPPYQKSNIRQGTQACGSAGKGRRVSWPDTVGKALVSEKLFMRDDETWRCGESTPCNIPRSMSQVLSLVVPNFQLPKSREALIDLLGQKAAQLEAVVVRRPLVFVTIQVLNLGFHKSVFVRYTPDNWATFVDIPCSFGASESCSDRFLTTMVIPTKCQEMQFAICFKCGGQEHWDNNNGANYSLSFSSEGGKE